MSLANRRAIYSFDSSYWSLYLQLVQEAFAYLNIRLFIAVTHLTVNYICSLNRRHLLMLILGYL